MNDYDVEKQLGNLESRVHRLEDYMERMLKSAAEWDAQLALVLKFSSRTEEMFNESTAWKAKVDLITRIFVFLFSILFGGLGVAFIAHYWGLRG